MATQKQLDALKKARAAKAKNTTKTATTAKRSNNLSGTREFKKTDFPVFWDYQVFVKGDLKKSFASLDSAKKYAVNLKTRSEISITEKRTHCVLVSPRIV
jgi:hypothetical protein